jgi:hypothetical protein
MIPTATAFVGPETAKGEGGCLLISMISQEIEALANLGIKASFLYV